MAKYLYVKIVVLIMALFGVVWAMQSLKSEPLGHSPESPIRAVLGVHPPSEK